MFWGVNLFDKQSIQLEQEIVITNLCGKGKVYVDSQLIAILDDNQICIELPLSQKNTIKIQGGNIDICGYLVQPLDFKKVEELSQKAQHMTDESQFKSILKEQLNNIKKMLQH